MVEIKSKYVYAALVLIVLAFFFWLFKLNGLLIIAGIFLFFFLPYYIIMKNLDLTQPEKIFFSFFIGWGLFPTVVYYLAIVLSSMKLSVLVSFLLLLTISLILNWKLSKNKTETTS